MALKTENKPEASPAATPKTVKDDTTVLELALYKIYTWGNYTYEQGKPYRFKNSDAMQLLAEQDTGRPVWRLYRAPVAKAAPKNEIVDATMVKAPEPVEELGPGGPVSRKRLDVGSDDEISDILNRQSDETSGDVVV